MNKKIRLWKLGYLSSDGRHVLPTQEAVEKVRGLIENATTNGVLDIVWGPELNVEMYEIDDEIDNYIVGADGRLVKVLELNE